MAVGLPERYEKAGITALLGSGFDPGVTSVFTPTP
jgi:saccharopine dehydrogenase (NAD+, L-lysine-forming)